MIPIVDFPLAQCIACLRAFPGARAWVNDTKEGPFCGRVCSDRWGRGRVEGENPYFVMRKPAHGVINPITFSARISVETNLDRVRRAVTVLAADLWTAGSDAFPFWRSDVEVISAVEAVADHRIGTRVSNGRLGRAYVRAWREDYCGLRTKWMQRAHAARVWRKT